MDQHIKCTAIVIGSPILRTLVNWLIAIFRPAQPTQLFADFDEALAFLRKHVPAPEQLEGPFTPGSLNRQMAQRA